MSGILTDQEIDSLVKEPKPLPAGYAKDAVLKARTGHSGYEVTVTGVNGNDFSIHARRSNENLLDFSVILSFTMKPSKPCLLA